MDEGTFSEVEKYIYGHHASKESLEQSKRQGCVACSEIDDVNVESLDRLGYCTIFAVQNGAKGFMMLIIRDKWHRKAVTFVPYSRK